MRIVRGLNRAQWAGEAHQAHELGSFRLALGLTDWHIDRGYKLSNGYVLYAYQPQESLGRFSPRLHTNAAILRAWKHRNHRHGPVSCNLFDLGLCPTAFLLPHIRSIPMVSTGLRPSRHTRGGTLSPDGLV
jgi:transposase InsO family protein